MSKEKEQDHAPISFRGRKCDISYVKEVAARRRMNESQVYRMLLETGVIAHKEAEKMGIVYISDFIHFVGRTIKEKVKSKSGVKAV